MMPTDPLQLLRQRVITGMEGLGGALPGILIATMGLATDDEPVFELGAWHLRDGTILPPQRPLTIAGTDLPALVELIEQAAAPAVEAAVQLEPDECRILGRSDELVATALRTPGGQRLFSLTLSDVSGCLTLPIDQLPALHRVLLASVRTLSELVLLAHEPRGPVQ